MGGRTPGTEAPPLDRSLDFRSWVGLEFAERGGTDGFPSAARPDLRGLPRRAAGRRPRARLCSHGGEDRRGVGPGVPAVGGGAVERARAIEPRALLGDLAQ